MPFHESRRTAAQKGERAAPSYRFSHKRIRKIKQETKTKIKKFENGLGPTRASIYGA
jgi:hypothetical protein